MNRILLRFDSDSTPSSIRISDGQRGDGDHDYRLVVGSCKNDIDCYIKDNNIKLSINGPSRRIFEIDDEELALLVLSYGGK